MPNSSGGPCSPHSPPDQVPHASVAQGMAGEPGGRYTAPSAQGGLRPPQEGGGDNSPQWGPDAARVAGAGTRDLAGTWETLSQRKISVPPSCSQARRSTPEKPPRDMRVRGTPLGTAGSLHGHGGDAATAGAPRSAVVGRDSIFSLLQAPTAYCEGPTAGRGGGQPPSRLPAPCETSLQPPSKTSQQLGRRHRQPLRLERSKAGSHRSDPEMAREGSAPARPAPHPELLCVSGPQGPPRLDGTSGTPQGRGKQPLIPPHTPGPCGVDTPHA